jgi:shikimate kinase
MKNKLDKPIVLVGMMGSGKSTVGRKLAKKIDLQFYDSDNIIEGREGLTIMDIHEYMGEKYFQQKEEETIKEILNYGRVVLSTGGSSFDNANIRKIIKEKAVCIWLDANIDTILERVSRRNTRPELIGSSKDEIIKKMTEKKSQFDQANIKIESDLEAHHLVSTLIMRLEKYLEKNMEQKSPK